jgi:hypothetical protein
MSTVRYRLFSEGDEEGSNVGKKVAIGAANVGAGLGIGYIGLKHEKKYLNKKLGAQEEAISRSMEASDRFAKKNLEGTKNKLKNLVNPRRRAVMEAREEDIWRRGAEKALKEANDTRTKLRRVNNLLDAPKKVADAIKDGAKKVGKEVTRQATDLKNKRRSADFLRKGKAYRRIVKK